MQARGLEMIPRADCWEKEPTVCQGVEPCRQPCEGSNWYPPSRGGSQGSRRSDSWSAVLSQRAVHQRDPASVPGSERPRPKQGSATPRLCALGQGYELSEPRILHL